MTEADYEYLLRTLSEARSRAAEIALGVRARVGVDHRLSQLGASAVSQIETVLREVRIAAEDQSDASRSEEIRNLQVATGVPARTLEKSLAEQSLAEKKPAPPPAPPTDYESEHWFPGFLRELLEHFRSSGGITFETVERALQERKQAFATDLEIARRMYRTYPHLFKQSETATR